MPHGNRVRVTKVVPTLQCGGTEKQFLALTASLDARRFDMECACLRQLGPFVSELADRRIPLREFPIRSFRGGASLPQQFRFATHLFRRRAHIVHAYNFYGNVFAVPAARLAGVPVVIASIRDRGPYLTKAQLRLQREVCRLADHILVNADAIKEWLAQDGYDASKISVIRNGVDVERFAAPPRGEALRAELGLPLDAPIVAVVSRLNPLKGLEHFLDAAATVAKRFARARFLIVGEPSIDDPGYLDALKAHARRVGVADKVIFTGLRHDVPNVLAGVTVSVMPSLNEGLSNSLLEAMAAGVPVVATRVGGTPEAIAGGVVGLLVPPGDSHALAESISRLLEDPHLAETMGRAARRSIEERFSLDRMVTATERVYVDLLAARYGARVPAEWLEPHPTPVARDFSPASDAALQHRATPVALAPERS
jgi:glycosyltransferase involved in cell wall biosynthesis